MRLDGDEPGTAGLPDLGPQVVANGGWPSDEWAGDDDPARGRWPDDRCAVPGGIDAGHVCDARVSGRAADARGGAGAGAAPRVVGAERNRELQPGLQPVLHGGRGERAGIPGAGEQALDPCRRESRPCDDGSGCDTGGDDQWATADGQLSGEPADWAVCGFGVAGAAVATGRDGTNPPTGWQPSGTGDYTNTCRQYAQTCPIQIVNEYRGPHVVVQKRWMVRQGSYAPPPYPAVTLAVTIDGVTEDVNCPAQSWSNWVTCGVLFLTSAPGSISVSERDLPAPWQYDGYTVSGNCARGCTLVVTNRRNPVMKIRKAWYRGSYPMLPSDVPAVTLEVTLTYQNGQTAQHTLTCPAGANPSPCGQIVLDDTIASADFQEPGLGEGWTFESPSSSQLSSCNSYDCTVTVTNRDSRYPVYVSKRWRGEDGSLLDPAQTPRATIEVTIDGTPYTFDCPAGVANPVECGQVVLPSRPSSITVTETAVGDEWVPVVSDVRECLRHWAEECRIEITNWRNGPYTIQVWKYWVDLWFNPVGTNQISSTTITVWVDGQAYTLTCPGNSNPDPCGEISLDRWPRSVVVDEPSVPSGWQVANGTGDRTTDCTQLGNPCYLAVTNRQEGMWLAVAKMWLSGLPGNLTAGPQTYVQVTVDGVPLVLTCPATAIGWTFCGLLAIPGRPTTIIADEPWLPAYWAYYWGAGDYSSSCAGQDSCGIVFINVRDEQRREGSSPEGLYVVDVRKEWLSDGQHTSDHPSTSLELTIVQGTQSFTLLLLCAQNAPSPQSCGGVTLTQRPDRVVVREPAVSNGWQAVAETVTVDNCPEVGPCVVTFTNEARQVSATGSYRLAVVKRWLDERGQDTSAHPATTLEVGVEGPSGSRTFTVQCPAGGPSPQECHTEELSEAPVRVTVREGRVPAGWVAVVGSASRECDGSETCQVGLVNAVISGTGSGGGGGGGTGSGVADEPVVEEPPPPGTPENPTQGGGSGGSNQGVGQQPPAQQSAERAEATYQGQDWSIEDERLSEALRERKKIESEELQVIQLLPRTGRGGGTNWPASPVALLGIALLLTGLALALSSRTGRPSVAAAGSERGASSGAGGSGSDRARPPRGGRHWSARGRGRPPVR